MAAQSHVPPLSDSSSARVSADAVEHAKESRERATRFRAAGDEAHAKLADGLAREWAETARDGELAATAEQMAADRRREAMRDQAQLQRTRTLSEEDIARLGRMRAELDAAVSATKGRLAGEVPVGGTKSPVPAARATGQSAAGTLGGKP